MPKKKTREEYIEELKIKNPTIVLIGEYINNRTPTEHHCKKHDILFNIRPYDALRGKGCRCCRSDKISAALLKTENEYIKDLSIKNPILRLIGEYKGANVPTEHYCLDHDIVWDIRPCNALSGDGCKYCKKEKIANKLRKSTDEYIKELADKNPNVVLVGDYVNSKMPVEHYCKKHNVVFNISPLSALRGCWCKYCWSDRLRQSLLKTSEEYKIELKNVNPYIILIGDYIGANVSTLHRCLLCGNEWHAKPHNVLYGCGCPDCNQSKGERQVKLWLEKNNVIYTPQKKFNDCCDKRPLPFDFYLDDYNICIEYQGQQHYEEKDYFGGADSLIYTQSHDKIKSEYCKLNNIRLICIPYWENVDEYLNENLLI